MASLSIRLVKLESANKQENHTPKSLSFFYGQEDDGTGLLHQSLNDFYKNNQLNEVSNG
ncbi:MAG: hypothetical protein QX199_20705 [Methylococcaceae bacterium]